MPVRPLAPTLQPAVRRRPEVLAPVGDHDSLRAALAAGADAVYLGLDDGFNARARAVNFPLAELPDTVAQVHRAGARLYVTLNTLVFEGELPTVARIVRRIAEAGVDAIIVQDPAVALLARDICPDLHVHASTQMTVSSAEGARFAASLGVTRVVVPRELSVSEIARLAEETPLELEVFIHGALCMSWSGQCLTSEAWGGRSANRGQCAQSCRLPYELVVDGEVRRTGDVRYLLSPLDLAGYRAVPALMEIGVHTLKIEGRLKGPAYVMTAVRGLRSWLDAIEGGRAGETEPQQRLAADLAAMGATYSRGFGDGFLGGSDHQTLVEGRFPKHRGVLLGEVVEVRRGAVVVRRAERPRRVDAIGELASPLPPLGGAPDAATGAAMATPEPRAGQGVGFDTGRPESEEPGGPIFSVAAEGDAIVLGFGRPGPDLSRVRPGHRVWLTNDPLVDAEAQRTVRSTEPEGRHAVSLRVWGAEGQPLAVEAACGPFTARAQSEVALAPATAAGIDAALLRDKLGGFGGTPFRLAELDSSELGDGLHLPVSQLKAMRRALLEALLPQVDRGAARAVLVEEPARLARVVIDEKSTRTRLRVLCRTFEQLEAVIAAGLDEVELDFMEMVGLGRAVARAREAGLRVTIATVRVQKPGEEGFDSRIAKLAPDGVLVRHWGALMQFASLPPDRRPAAVDGDFSLNVTNSITAEHLLGLGLSTFTVAHDLDKRQLMELLAHVPAAATVVTVHHHIATFHTEHCVYAHMLSNGRDFRTCGRPCEEHRVALRDQTGDEHPVIVDVGCRNTVFNARAQTAASLAPALLSRGVGGLRIEFVWETRAQAADVIAAWMALVEGRLSPQALVKRVGVHEQFGVTAGTMQTLRA